MTAPLAVRMRPANLDEVIVSLYGLEDPRPSPICDRHGGAWGQDETSDLTRGED